MANRIHVLEGADLAHVAANSASYKPMLEFGMGKAMSSLYGQLGGVINEGIPQGLINYVRSMGYGDNKSDEAMQARAIIEKSIVRPMNQRASRVRNLMAAAKDPNWLEDKEFEKSLSKATLDVGTLTNFANITGGQSLGYVSLDTRIARSTIRPSSFTLYQALDKSLAWQVVDFWAVAKSTGGNPPGSAFANYSNVSSGSLTTNAGTYDLNNIILKLAVDGRAITTALAAQNNYINISEQESANAALNILSSFDWAAFHGNSTIYSNQFDGIGRQIISAGYQSTNLFDFYQYSNNFAAARSWTPEEALYNQIYEASAQITGYANFGHITHAFMDPATMGDLQGLATTLLNNIVNQISEIQDRAPIVINGNLIGMQTRYGHIQFPMDLLITARDIPVGAIVVDGHTQCLGDNIPNGSNLNNPTSVVGTVVTGASATGSNFNGSYTPVAGGGGSYAYCVVAADASMNETLPYNSTTSAPSGALGTANSSYSALVSGVTSGSAVQVAITPNGSAASAFRVFRSGLGGVVSTSAPTPTEFRYIGDIAANGSSVVTFTDLNGGINGTNNTRIPGSTEIYLLDMDPMDLAIDFRLLLPLVRVELFASNLYMPWAVAAIGSVRLRIPKFHGVIKNFVPASTSWNPLTIN